MSDQAVSEFMSITGCSDAARAKFFLDAASNDLSAAITNFFDAGGNDAQIDQPMEQVAEPAVPEPAPAAAAPEPRLAGVSMGGTQRGRNDGPREFSVGGEKSGLAVMKDENQDNDSYVKSIFKRAQENAGATDEDPSEKKERFSGGGYKLGGDGHASQRIEKPKPKEPEKVKITMWKDGFTINDEDIRLYSEPRNQQFLDQVTSGRLPTDLLKYGTEVALEMEDRRQDDYEENKPKPQFKAFTGSGNRLGASDAGPSVPPPKAPATESLVNIDESKSKTKLRFRLASGKQLVQEFNQDHTISDIKKFCDPHAGGRSYELRSGFPPKPLDLNSTSSLVEAKLLNETVIQRLL
ncbi:Oidioi.mRNA.OKI2018_I69.chr2.g8291.t1.cds [Oikopleura dioica]|uniref:Oidioi.mRNA.OKI2018_I69.chr2.g8291.t1.cds n=1 Tax=Oikopleura dioica TaxID=34765 RepID=A0ABN7TBY5_OIKDI|nr:Oidioi.mRNA.OKI2018_I69.chr2.g8291.t1.cds [Oikopleura dioica]